MVNKSGKQKKQKEGGGWKEFWGFFRKVKLSWGWIMLSLVISIAYYAVVSFIPGSTAALYAGDSAWRPSWGWLSIIWQCWRCHW